MRLGLRHLLQVTARSCRIGSLLGVVLLVIVGARSIVASDSFTLSDTEHIDVWAIHTAAGGFHLTHESIVAVGDTGGQKGSNWVGTCEANAAQPVIWWPKWHASQNTFPLDFEECSFGAMATGTWLQVTIPYWLIATPALAYPLVAWRRRRQLKSAQGFSVG